PIEERKNPLPHRLEATGEVSAFSPEMVVLKSAYINVWFKDVVKPVVPPEHLPPPRDNPLVSKEPMPVVNNAPKDLDAPPAAKKQTAKKDPPMIVRHARRIEVWVARADGKNDLDKVHTEGDVVIHQDPTQSNERGIDIAGITVDVEHHLEGNYLVVIGNEQTLGEVHFDKVSIIADDIKIDQRDNTANVKGPGSMRMLSATDLKGDKLAKSTYIDVYWNDAMELDGPIRSVRYEGAVTAKQNDGKVLCEVMQVWLDQPLYLNQADRARETTPLKKGESRSSPKVEKVLCDQLAVNAKAMKTKKLLPVSIEDVEKVNNIITKYQNVQGSQIEMDNVQNKMTSIGPGTVKMFQAGSKDPLANQPAANPKLPMRKKADDEETKFTWVSFDQRMVAFNNVPKRAVFYSNVEAVHMPSKDHEVKIDIARLPEGAVHIRCQEKMEVTSQVRKIRDANGKEIEQKWQEMKAEGNVRVRGDDFEGWAGVVTFTEEKSLLVFNGTVNNPATLSRLEAKGGERKTFRGEKITYNVKTKDCSVDGSVGGNTN
ncbi:MAG: hypothetical protein K8T89_23070, partial [Planctomycetes bacterium]|nr:hypothetical protein [Planctomycetota bacterium]